MYGLKYKVTTSACDSEGRLKLYSALQMMQDCSEMWIDSEPGVKQYFTEQNMAQLLATRQVEIIVTRSSTIHRAIPATRHGAWEHSLTRWQEN